jgi:hypothetical protein
MFRMRPSPAIVPIVAMRAARTIRVFCPDPPLSSVITLRGARKNVESNHKCATRQFMPVICVKLKIRAKETYPQKICTQSRATNDVAGRTK